MTTISITIPDNVMQRLQGQWTNVSQRALEAVASEAYRMGILTAAEVQQTLGLRSRWEVDAVLKRAQANFDYTEADLEQDRRTLEHVKVAGCL